MNTNHSTEYTLITQTLDEAAVVAVAKLFIKQLAPLAT
jgi:hypothetical protein